VGATQRNLVGGPHGVKTVQWMGAREAPNELVTHLRARGISLVTKAAGAAMEAARVGIIEPASMAVLRAPSLTGRRIAVMLPDPGAADALAQALRARGAEVAVLSLDPDTIERVESLDPDVVLMEATDFYGSCWEIVRALWQHARLRYASVLLATPTPSAPDGSSVLDVTTLSIAVQAASAAYERLREKVSTEGDLEVALDLLGPARTLRVLLESKRSLRAEFVCMDLTVEVDLVDEIIVGARGGHEAQATDTYLGPHALAELMQRHEGKVSVRAVEHPSVTNIMAPFETALHVARETLVPSRPSGLRFRSVSVPAEVSALPARPPVPTPREGWTAATPPAPEGEGQGLESPRRAPAPIERTATLAHGGPKLPPTKPRSTLKPAIGATAALPRTGATLGGVYPPLPVIDPRKIQPAKNEPVKVSKVVLAGAAIAPLIGLEDQPEPRVRAKAATGSIPLTELSGPIAQGPESSGRVASRIDNVVTKRRGPVIATTRIGLPEPNVVTRDASTVVAVASRPPPAPPAPPEESLQPGASGAPEAFGQTLLSMASPAQLEGLLPPQPLIVISEAPFEEAEQGAQPALDTTRYPRLLGEPRQRLLLALPALLALLWLGAAAFGLPGSVSTPPVLSVPSQKAAARSASRPPIVAAAPAPVVEPPVAPLAATRADDRADEGAQESPRSRRARAKRASQLVGQGHSFRKRGLLPSAKQRYVEALREYPGYPRAVAGLAQVALALGDPTQAVSYARQLVRARPSQLEYLVLLGDAYKAAGLPSQAREAWQSAARRGSRTAHQRLAS